MSKLAIIGLVNSITCLSLGLLVLASNRRNKLNQVYFGFNLIASIYTFAYFCWQISTDYDTAFYWFKFLFIGSILINFMYIPFVFTLVGNIKGKKLAIFLFGIVDLIFIVLTLNGNLFYGLEPRFNLGFWPNIKKPFNYFLVFWHFSVLYGFAWIIYGIRINTGIKKQQIKLATIACAIGYIGGVSNWPMFYSIRFPPHLSILISAYVALIAYAILKHRLLDFGLIMRWGLAYFLLASSLILIVGSFVIAFSYISEFFFKVNFYITTLLGVCFSIFLIEPLKKRISYFVDKIIFNSPDLQKVLDDVTRGINQEKEIENLSKNLSRTFKSIWKVNHAGLAIMDFKTGFYKMFPSGSFSNSALDKLSIKINNSDFLIKTLESERRLFWHGVVVDEEVQELKNRAFSGEKITFSKILRTMRWLGASACVPMMKNDSLIGFIILGRKIDYKIFNNEDKKFLTHISNIITDRVLSLNA